MSPEINEPSRQETPRLLSPSDTAKRVAMSWRTVSRLVRKGEFPSPVRLSTQRIAFLEDEVSGWIATRPRVAEAA